MADRDTRQFALFRTVQMQMATFPQDGSEVHLIPFQRVVGFRESRRATASILEIPLPLSSNELPYEFSGKFSTAIFPCASWPRTRLAGRSTSLLGRVRGKAKAAVEADAINYAVGAC